ncbi:MAG: hypothetical protein ACI8UO_005308 [Verrucomicrobiales bacterium]|jgi:hypothetical protein
MRVRILGGPFRGAPMRLALRGSKRKILGVYEHELTPWWRKVLTTAEVLFDVGAGDGYFTYGVAHRLAKRGVQPKIIAFEPGMDAVGLTEASNWRAYREVEFEFVPKLVGATDNDEMVTLDRWDNAHEIETIVKVDVEGAEVDVLEGAQQLLARTNTHWVVEVHGRELIEPVSAKFEQAEREFALIEPRPHPTFGAEARGMWTGWIVTE